MADPVLATNKISKRYGKFHALRDVSITLDAGRIYGLIGQNGAGKSTLMRVLSGLSYPSAGTMELFGHSGERELQMERKRIGCMIEYPSLTLSMTAKENLKHHRIMKGIPNTGFEDELLGLVGLSATHKKKAKDFSLGMKQRLGIAIALLGNPEILILDEPINGLDPIGVVDVRKLLKKLCDERQMTILISSHNLPELYQTATDYIVIHQGAIKKALTLTELEDNCEQYILIGCSDPDKLVGVIETELNTSHYKVMPNGFVKLYDYLLEKEWVSGILIKNGIVVTNFSSQEDSLENYFISMVGGDSDV